jgi:integrase/recombinase XerC
VKSYQYKRRAYAEGERHCPKCDGPLPAHETWPGMRHRFCQECAAIVKDTELWRYIAAGTYRCESPGCTNFIPEGQYYKKAAFLTCCGECWVSRQSKGNRLLMCGCGCGEEFLGRAKRKPIGGLYFKSQRHYGACRHKQNVIKASGVFHDLVTEYLEGFAKVHYSDQCGVRGVIGLFFTFLNERGITSIEDPYVTPKTITDFLIWGSAKGRIIAQGRISLVSTFFKWAAACGYRKAGNPVIPMIHRKRMPRRAPRPLEDEQVEFTWKLLNERGNPRLRLAMAIGIETGARIGEICRFRLKDINIKGRRVFVRLPNKGKKERWANFSDLTVKYYAEWMAVRDPDCGHDQLLHNTRGNPCTHQALRKEFNRTLCKSTPRRKKTHTTGVDKWSMHQLRHTMASTLASAGADANVIMAQGGWASLEAMSGYTRVDDDLAKRGYEQAMRLSKEKKMSKPTKKSLSLAEYLDHAKLAS